MMTATRGKFHRSHGALLALGFLCQSVGVDAAAEVTFSPELRIARIYDSFLNFVTSYNYYDFQGSGFGSEVERTLSRNIFHMGIEVTYPGRPR